jgi:hypothetical protein
MREPHPAVPDHPGAQQALAATVNENNSERSCIPMYDFMKKLVNTYDGAFLLLLGMQNVNHGLWSIAILACQDLYKTYLKLDPGQMTLYMSIIHIPWSVKILYGLISDNVPIFGSKRRSYVMIMGTL